MSFQAYLDNIKTKTGKSPGDFKKLADKKGLLKPGIKAGEIVAWLKEDFDLGHGHAMAIYAVLKEKRPVETIIPRSTAEIFPGKIAKPAQRALANAGITGWQQLSKLTEIELMQLHGIGQNAFTQLKNSLKEQGLSFSSKKK